MERFIKGDVVVLPFPFSDLSQTKRRPALVINQLKGDDLILCAITSQIKLDKYAIVIENNDFISGSLNRNSYVRVNRLFTAENKIIAYKVGNLKPQKIAEIINKLIEILQN
jgi:mRNA interferase MazF